MLVLVVGAGVLGLAIARAAALAGHEVIVAEAANAIGTGVSSRNSEVIHAGLYYPTGSKRAHHCPRSRRMLYDFCASHGVPHRKCGKLVVATNASEVRRLEGVLKQAQTNGIEGVELIEGAAAKRLEPELACLVAMVSPVPIPGGLGVHVTLDLAGRMRFGPDVQWIAEENYDVDASRAAAFYARIRDYFPRLPDNSLVPDYAGIRPKLTAEGEPAADFMIDTPREHGLP